MTERFNRTLADMLSSVLAKISNWDTLLPCLTFASTPLCSLYQGILRPTYFKVKKRSLTSTPFFSTQKLHTTQRSWTLPAAQNNVNRLLTFADLTLKLRPSCGRTSAAAKLSTKRAIRGAFLPVYWALPRAALPDARHLNGRAHCPADDVQRSRLMCLD